MCAGTSEVDMSNTGISRGPDAEVVRVARGSATVPALRAMSCQLDALNGLLRDAEYDNAEFYRSTIEGL